MKRSWIGPSWRAMALMLLPCAALMVAAVRADGPVADKPDFVVLPCQNVKASEVARVLVELYGGRGPAQRVRIVADDASNSLLIQAAPADVERLKDMVKRLEALQPREVGRMETRIFSLKNVQIDQTTDRILKLMFINAQGSGEYALDPVRNSVIVRGDRIVLNEVEALLSRLEDTAQKQAQEKPQVISRPVRVVWLVDGPGRENDAKPSKDLEAVLAELTKLGIKEPRVAGQWLINTSPNEEFHAEGTLKLEAPTRAVLSGSVTSKPDGASLRIAIKATQDAAKGSLPICQLETQIAAPFGHYVVLGATPTNTMTSVFVVQVLMK